MTVTYSTTVLARYSILGLLNGGIVYSFEVCKNFREIYLMFRLSRAAH